MHKSPIEVDNKKVTVAGLGLHGGGVSTVNWLLKHGAHITITDLRDDITLRPSLNKILKNKNVKYVLGKHRKSDFKDADIVIKNPAVPRESKYIKTAKKHKVAIETDISIFFSRCPSTIIGVTGSKGKSTTATLIYNILREAGESVFLAGNIRKSPLDIVDNLTKKSIVVLELSSWQLEDSIHFSRSPHVAIVTNILRDHLNRYKSFDHYRHAKHNIFMHQTKDDFAVLNADNKKSKVLLKKINAQKAWFSYSDKKKPVSAFVSKNRIKYRVDGRTEDIVSIKKLKIKGEHNIENTLAAVAAVKAIGVRTESIQKAITDFKGIPDRFELIGTKKSVDVYNDTTATTPDATIASLKTLKKNIILIAGGSDKELDYRLLAREIKKRTNFLILLPGTATDKLLNEFKKLSFKKYQEVYSMRDAVKLAFEFAPKKSHVVLSPGAASFGLFLNEFDRGDKFKKEVQKFLT